MKRLIPTLLLSCLIAAPLSCQAQQQTIYGPDGKPVARVTTGTNGTTTTYGSDGARSRAERRHRLRRAHRKQNRHHHNNTTQRIK
jgi:hypothetical protein